MRFIQAPSLAATLQPQRYEPLGNRVVRYHAGDFRADIEFDAEGFVTLYHDYLERLSVKET
jgi:hypothetical protein